MKKNKIFLENGQEAELAEYKEQEVEDYKGNPFIEALPPIWNQNDVIDMIATYPTYNDHERFNKTEIKVHQIQKIFQLFEPLEIHLRLQRKISNVIRRGYVARNPIRKEYIKSFEEGHNCIINKNLNVDINKARTSSSGFTIIGTSGIGKTTSINRILSLYPQVIIHSSYKDIRFSMYQLTWLKLDCPHDGSIKGLCLDFFIQIDNILGTNYYKKHGKHTMSVNAMMPILAQVARSCGIGLLVIDEIQHLSLAKSGGAEKMLNFFVTLVNTIGIPVILIGTMKALPILQSQFRQARRGSGQGDEVWINLKRDDTSWNLLMDSIFDYQWTDEKIEITEELSDAIYYNSQGIIDIAVKLYAMAQIEVVIREGKSITPKIIGEVANEHFKLVKPMIEALRVGDSKKISKYEDLISMDINDFLENNYIDMQNQKEKELLEIRAKQRNKVKESAVSILMMFNLSENIVKEQVNDEIRKNPNIELGDLIKLIHNKLSCKEENQNEKKQKKFEPKDNYKDELDLRSITKDKELNYSELLKNGYIIDDF